MKNSEVNSGFGISTLVMVFMVLCLCIFATLTYVQANYNYTQSNKIVESKTQYYNADYKATLLYRELKEALDSGNLDDAFLRKENIEYVDNLYCYNISINENKTLKVELEYVDSSLNVVTWKEVVSYSDDYDYQAFVD